MSTQGLCLFSCLLTGFDSLVLLGTIERASLLSVVLLGHPWYTSEKPLEMELGCASEQLCDLGQVTQLLWASISSFGK